MDRIRVAVLGASGYTGADAVRLLLTHPQVTIVALAAQQKAGQAMSEAWPHFMGAGGLPRLVAPEDVPFDRVDVVLGCLPHGASAAVLAGLEAVRILDLSADFRLKDAATYRAWYGLDHPAPHLLAEAVYGLSEYAREHLPAARLVACPGCYPTAVLLALLPLARAGLIAPEGIAVFAISGVSGAGRALKESYLFCEVGEAAAPYGVGHHRHMPEIEQELGAAFGQEVRVGFTPHLVPMNRESSSRLRSRWRPGPRLPTCAPPSTSATRPSRSSTCWGRVSRPPRAWCVARTSACSTCSRIGCRAERSWRRPSTTWSRARPGRRCRT